MNTRTRLLLAVAMVVDDRSGARVGANADLSLVAVYRPHPLPVTLAADLTGHEIVTWDLAHRRRDTGRAPCRAAGATVVGQPDFLGDSVQIFRAGP